MDPKTLRRPERKLGKFPFLSSPPPHSPERRHRRWQRYKTCSAMARMQHSSFLASHSTLKTKTRASDWGEAGCDHLSGGSTRSNAQPHSWYDTVNCTETAERQSQL
ncbi:hypothetical protein AG1IA_02501 [Rhizoctonia solani AG-1 IA]|uniref:Uncharacterized protein n=1 Tax=Thanatephorus cucumeris (strain AG1-IA) TaxID=983506 RepID=L8WZQ4_THACA|nr:hypothetical protein AG1IA_02501 [Rhizoctonia solani AG-1 IA]